MRDPPNASDPAPRNDPEEDRDGTRSPGPRRAVAEYALAIAATGASALLRWALPTALSPAPYLGFYPAVVVSAALGGVGPGLVSTVASLLLVNFVFGRFNVADHGALARQIIWVVASVGVSVVAGMQRAARMREHRAQAALRESEERLRLSAHAAGIGVWSWTPGTSSVTVDARWRHLFGVALDAEVTLETWRDALHPDDRDRAVRELNAASDAHRDFDVEYRVVQPDGAVRWIVDRGRARYDAEGRAIRMAGVNVDVSDLKRAEEALREADRAKDEFLGMLSHELRNPLAPIRNSIYVLSRVDGASPQASRARAVIERQVEHLTRLVDDLLDVTRIARGKIQLRRERVDLHGIVARAAEDFRPTLEGRGVAFRADVPDAPIWAHADATRITQVIGNVLHNAAKFTRPGDEVSLSLQAGGPTAEIRVRDTGAGIEPALLPRIFDAFVQGDRTLARTEGGLGLGLALVKHITELHGGTVRAESAGKGLGTALTVMLPVSGAADVAAAAGESRAEANRRARVADE